jgi:hypothetical protein
LSNDDHSTAITSALRCGGKRVYLGFESLKRTVVLLGRFET